MHQPAEATKHPCRSLCGSERVGLLWTVLLYVQGSRIGGALRQPYEDTGLCVQESNEQ